MTKKMMLVMTPRLDKFADLVNQKLADGWDLHGVPFTSKDNQIAQTLIKEEADVKGSTTKKTGGSV
jgi:hypothetical protein